MCIPRCMRAHYGVYIHTQRCGRCQSSRYLYGQRRGLPLSRTICPASRSRRTIRAIASVLPPSTTTLWDERLEGGMAILTVVCFFFLCQSIFFHWMSENEPGYRSLVRVLVLEPSRHRVGLRLPRESMRPGWWALCARSGPPSSTRFSALPGQSTSPRAGLRTE